MFDQRRQPEQKSGASAPRFLRVPPFPGAKVDALRPASGRSKCEDRDSQLLKKIQLLRVGGTFWAAQPEIPDDYLLIRSARAIAACDTLVGKSQPILWLPDSNEAAEQTGPRIVTGDCDPWHMLSSASAVVLEAEDELRVIAALLGVEAYLFRPDTGRVELDTADALDLLACALPDEDFENPFTGSPMSAAETVELCGFWRRLIDSNRDVAGGLGFAFWKQDHVAPLLWNGSEPVKFRKSARDLRGGSVAIWRSKALADQLEALERAGVRLIEVEDGFLRSQGLGADCIPPLSITVDRLRPHFDASGPSELELLIEGHDFDARTLDRARRLRRVIVEAGLGKYERSGTVLARTSSPGRRQILVAGQVEDDRAVQCGGCGLDSNLELLKRVRDQVPDGHILYKPHPDVLAGHRRGAVPERDCLAYVDEIVGSLPISTLIGSVDEIHVNTSLTGFEALMRGKPVTTYGVPFYAGWGLTTDLGPVPARRTARRTLDEVVAATLLLYPRYLDPVTGLPCPAEVVVARLIAEGCGETGMLVSMRRLQGRLMRGFRSLAL